MAQNWDDLRVFLSVARGQSLSAAGKQLRIDPATVGRRIARLEQRMGTALFAKSPLGYELSVAGARLLPLAEQAEQAMGAAGDLMVQGGARAGEISGSIRIGAPDGCANFLLPQVCARIVAAHPDLDVQIVALPRVVNLSKREADMAITVSAPSAGRLTVQKLCDYKLHLAASPEYLAKAAKLRTKQDLKGHRMIGYIPDMIFDKELDYLGALGVERVPLASNSVAVQFHAIRQGAGLGVVHDFALPSAPVLQRVLMQEVSLLRSFYLVRHSSDRRLQRLNRFAEALVSGVRAEISHLEGLCAAR
ncbi:LysR family transcriptional regulator [Planktotalea arctica]|uniref:LysR family transcriptional regulator n=1 Tax=Planktotalea arctica TaxID=1481893 RepID=UPI000A16CCF1|nr:LysR family transcriptional regulator [Planktotalea arctica]